MSETSQEGRRERKKRETREAIATAAAGLFSARGFDAVTVAEVAEAADVSVQTVYNHFPAKDDLVFDRAAEREAEVRSMLDGVAPGEPIVPAFRRATHAWLDRMAAVGEEEIHDFFGIVHSSPALQGRMLETFGRERELIADAVARVYGTETDLVAHSAANALQGVNSMIVGAFATLRGEGRTSAEVAATLRPQIDRAFDLLEQGLR